MNRPKPFLALHLMGKRNDILELMRRIESPEDEENLTEIQNQLDAKMAEILAHPDAKLLTRESLMGALQKDYKKHLLEIEKKADIARRGNFGH